MELLSITGLCLAGPLVWMYLMDMGRPLIRWAAWPVLALILAPFWWVIAGVGAIVMLWQWATQPAKPRPTAEPPSTPSRSDTAVSETSSAGFTLLQCPTCGQTLELPHATNIRYVTRCGTCREVIPKDVLRRARG